MTLLFQVSRSESFSLSESVPLALGDLRRAEAHCSALVTDAASECTHSKGPTAPGMEALIMIMMSSRVLMPVETAGSPESLI